MQQPMQPLPQQPLPQQPLPQQPPPQQPPALPPGTLLLGRYLIQGYIGGGGFGHIYKAQDKILGHRRAIKEAFYRDMQTQRQFRLEAEFILNARHPNLVRGYAVFEQGGRFYLVMDYVDGQTVEEIAIQYIRRSGRPLPEAQVLDWVLPICDAVHALHSQPTPIIHRDVKPANIKITRAGSPMLIDLGLAKLYNQGMQTVGAALAFTPGYAPPEQYQASGSTDQRTDVYGLGATLFYLLTGYQPTEAPARLGPHTLPSPRVLNPAISVLTEAAVFKAMALDPARRQQSAHELDLELRAARAALDVGRAASGELSEAVARQAPCAQCGTANVATARFCMRCGAVLHHVAELAAPAVAARLREPERVVVGMAVGGHQPAAVVAAPSPSPAPLPPPALAPMPAPAPLPAPARPRIPTPLPTPAPAAAPTPVAGRQAGLAAQLPPAETHPEPVPIGAQPPRVPAARAPLPAAEAAPASEPQASTSAARGAFYRTSVTLNRDPEEARTVVATILAVVCVSLSFLALVAGWAIVFAAPAAVLSGWSWYRDHDDMPPELRVIAPSALVLATLWPPIWIGIAAPGGWKLLALAWLVVVGAWPAGRLAYQYWLDRNERFYS